MTRNLLAEALSAYVTVLWAGLSAALLGTVLAPAPAAALSAASTGLVAGLIHGRVGAMAPSIGNPLLAIGLYAGGRLAFNLLVPTLVAGIAGSVAAALSIFLAGGPAAIGRIIGGYGEFSAIGAGGVAVFAAEAAVCFLVVIALLAITHRRGPARLASLWLALAFAAAGLVLQPVSGGMPHPAQHLGLAMVMGPIATSQAWLFWLASLIGGGAAGLVWARRFEEGFRARPARS